MGTQLDDYQDQADQYGGEAVETITEKLTEYRKAIAAFLTTTVIPTATLWLGADSRIVVALTALGATVSVTAVANARRRARR